MTSMVVPIFIDGKFAGIVGQDILIDTLISDVKNTKIFDTGYLFLIDSAAIFSSIPIVEQRKNRFMTFWMLPP